MKRLAGLLMIVAMIAVPEAASAKCHGPNNWSAAEMSEVADIVAQIKKFDPAGITGEADVGIVLDKFECSGVSHDVAVQNVLGLARTRAALRDGSADEEVQTKADLTIQFLRAAGGSLGWEALITVANTSTTNSYRLISFSCQLFDAKGLPVDTPSGGVVPAPLPPGRIYRGNLYFTTKMIWRKADCRIESAIKEP